MPNANDLSISTPLGRPTISENRAVEAYLEQLRSEADPPGTHTEPRLMDLGPVGCPYDANDPNIVEDPDSSAPKPDYPDLITVFDKAVVINPHPVSETQFEK